MLACAAVPVRGRPGAMVWDVGGCQWRFCGFRPFSGPRAVSVYRRPSVLCCRPASGRRQGVCARASCLRDQQRAATGSLAASVGAFWAGMHAAGGHVASPSAAAGAAAAAQAAAATPTGNPAACNRGQERFCVCICRHRRVCSHRCGWWGSRRAGFGVVLAGVGCPWSIATCGCRWHADGRSSLTIGFRCRGWLSGCAP